MKLKARELADFLNATIDGNPDIEVSHPSKIEEAQPGSISFLGNPKYEPYAYTTAASILVVSNDFKPQQEIKSTLLRVPNVYQSLSLLLSRFDQNNKPAGISENASIDKTATIGKEVAVGFGTVIEKNARIGKSTVIYSQVYVGTDVQIGENCIIYPGVKIYNGCTIGNNVILHSNVVVGSDGFGFTPDNGELKKVPQLGNVIIRDNVEIGANTCIDRATMGSTIIGTGVKIDNLVQIAHNVEIGAHTVIASQTGIAGSTKIGSHSMIGGQVGIVGHIQIPEGTQIQAQSGVMSVSEEKNQKLFGYPAIAYRDYLKSYALFRNLPNIEKRLHDVEKKLKPD